VTGLVVRLIQARLSRRLGRARIWAGVLLLVLSSLITDGAQSRPANFILDMLQLGSRHAPGLGGDPFLSPIMRQSGWWKQELLDDNADIQLRNYQYLPVTPRLSSGVSQIEAVYTEIGGRYVIQRWQRQLSLGVSLVAARNTTALNKDLVSISLGQDGKRVAGLARLDEILPGLAAQVTFPVSESDSWLAGERLAYGFNYNWRGRLYLGSSRSHWDDRGSIIALFDDEVVASPLNIDVKEFRHEARLRIWRGLAVELSLSEADYLHGHALEGSQYEFLPEAWSNFRQQSVEWGQEWGLRLLFRHSDAAMKGSGGGYWEGARYLRVSHTHAQIESYLGAVQFPLGPNRRIFADVEFSDWDFFGRFGIDSWRFASWEQAWSGAKKVIQLGGSGRWERYHLGFESRTKAWDWGGGLSYYDIYPDAFSESWIHIPFVSPQAYEESNLAIDRFSLGAISLKVIWRMARFDITAELHQFVYGDDHLDPQPGPEPDPQPPTDQDSGFGGWVGGSYAEFSIGYSW